MAKKAKGGKIRIDFRKNHQGRRRPNDLTRKFQQERLDDQQLTSGERISGKGDLTRRRTVIAEHSEADGFGVQFTHDENVKKGVVLRVHGLECVVRAEDGTEYRCAVRRVLKNLSTDQRHVVAAGDIVTFRSEGAQQGIILAIDPRHGVLSRTSKGRKHVLVANIDQIIIVASANQPTLKPHLIDRFLVTAEHAGLDALICINKVDLADPAELQPLVGVYRIPKGVLLNGPPGTGKTLLARAVAGEAGVPFYSVNGSEFIQMFVGVGASRVRDLFQTAKDTAPSIVFIDEIDAVGRQRGAGLGGGHDEREQTLNQILSEMDGFAGGDSVIVVAATNRPDVLDPALLRPGRFDRHITVGRPTFRGRLEIFKVHVRDVPLDHDVDLKRLAAVTIGLTGADIRNLVNEAALWAARNDKSRVSMEDFDYARDKVLMGAKREEVLKQDEKEKTAYHEAGHTLTAWFLRGAQRVHKVTIIPRGRALGTTQILPAEDRVSTSESELQDQLVVLLAGRAAEVMIYDETSVGAENDLERATSVARRMVTHWGMSEKLGPVSYKSSDDDPFLGREIHQQRQFSEHTQELIDDEVSKILGRASERAFELLKEKRQELEALKEGLIAREELNEREIEALIGPSIHGPSESPEVSAHSETAV